MSTDGLAPSRIASSLHMLADLIQHDGTPGRTYADQALTTDYQVSDPQYVEEFAARHDLTVTRFDDAETIWAELPIGPGTLYGQTNHSATYQGAVVLRVVFPEPRPEAAS